MTTQKENNTETKSASKKQRSYFTKNIVNRYTLDDGESFIEHQKLDEGLFQRYQDLTSTIKLDREGESTEVDMALGRQREFLLDNLVVGWNLVDENNDPVKFSHKELKRLPPHIITGLINDIYNQNEILSGADEDEEGKD